MVLLHGFPDTAHTWDRTMDELARAGYRAIAPFMRGYHPTEIPGDGKYDSDTLGKDVLSLIDKLADERVILVGHDWGASAAYAAAALAADRLRLLVTLAVPHPRAIKPNPAMLWRLRHFVTLRRRGIAAKIRASNFAYIDELWRRWSPAWKDIPASETAAVKTAFAEPGCCEAACAYYRFIGAKQPRSLRTDITVPAVAFAGVDDSIMTPRMYEKARTCFTASYEVVQVPGGHFMHRERPDEWTHELLRTLADKAPNRSPG